MSLVREAAGDDAAFMTGLCGLAKRDAVEAIERLHEAPFDPEAYDAARWAELARCGRRLAVSATLVAQHEQEHASG